MDVEVKSCIFSLLPDTTARPAQTPPARHFTAVDRHMETKQKANSYANSGFFFLIFSHRPHHTILLCDSVAHALMHSDPVAGSV